MLRLDQCCLSLESSKITERRKCCAGFSDLINDDNVVQSLNTGPTTWNGLLHRLQTCLEKDAEKAVDDSRKKGTQNISKPISGDAFFTFIQTAVTRGNNLKLSAVIGYIVGCLKLKKMKLCYENIYLVTLKDCILSQVKTRQQLDTVDWIVLFEAIKSVCDQNISNEIEILYLKCYMLIIKWGPLYGFPGNILRGEFNNVCQICNSINQFSPRTLQETVVETVLQICMHTAKDNRISCCKLGEDAFGRLSSLYQVNAPDQTVNIQLLDFFLLQVTIHNPKGAIEVEPSACASSWESWYRCLGDIYNILNKEIIFYLENVNQYKSIYAKKKTIVTLDKFVTLFVEVSNQLFQNNRKLDLSFITQTWNLTEGAGPHKRKKMEVEISMKQYINFIQETKSGLWIKLVASILEAYPQSIDEKLFVSLLQILAKIQVECKDIEVTNCLYCCLGIMDDVENSLLNEEAKSEMGKLWKAIANSALSAISLNQNVRGIQTLLQKLFIKRKVTDLEPILQTYSSSRVLNITKESIQTLEITMQNISPKSTVKQNLIKCILNYDNLKDFKHLLCPETAKFLVSLTLRQWPQMNVELSKESGSTTCDHLDEIQDIYQKTVFNTTLTNIEEKSSDIPKSIEGNNFNIDSDLVEYLYSYIESFVNHFSSGPGEQIVTCAVFLINIASVCARFNMTTQYISLLQNTLHNPVLRNTILNFNTQNEKDVMQLIDFLNLIQLIFAFNGDEDLVRLIRVNVPLEFLQALYLTLQNIQEAKPKDSNKKRIIEWQVNVKKHLIQVLSDYCCTSDVALSSDNQLFMFEVLASPNSDCKNDDEYLLVITFLQSLKHCKVGYLSDDLLNMVITLIHNICVDRYQDYYSVVDILPIICDLYPHVAASNIDKSMTVNWLSAFLKKHLDYGPEVSVALLKCITQLCRLDPEFKFAVFYDNKEVIMCVPKFLQSDYQQVRFEAISTLVTFFIYSSKTNRLLDFHRQEMVLNEMYEMSIKVFDIEGEFTAERRKDEVITRTASVLHTFASIILTCNIWIEEALLTLMKLVHCKKLRNVEKVIAMLNMNLNLHNKSLLLEKHVEYIVEKWLNLGYDLDNLPFVLLDCTSKEEFYSKYLEVSFPLLVANDRTAFLEIVQKHGLAERDVVEKTCPKIFVKGVVQTLDNKRDIIQYLEDTLGIEHLKEILLNRLDDVILHLLNLVTDEKHISENFEECVIYFAKYLSVVQFSQCLHFVEEYLCGCDFISYLTSNFLYKTETVLLQLKRNIYDCVSLEDKLKLFHRYTIFFNLLQDKLTPQSTWQTYFIRHTIYSLIHLMENNTSEPKLALVVCKFLYQFLSKILPKFSDNLKFFLMFLVNSLKNLAISNEYLCDPCIDILDFIIVKNASLLMDSIEKLDEFPQEPKFENIRDVYHRIKYGNDTMTLANEIKYFLQVDDLSCSSTRQDSLKHLRQVLSTQKKQLEELYKELHEIRGFSEDCQKSLLHQLIGALVKMSSSPNERVSFEATACLGELGPSNLMTLVLKPEKEICDLKCTPFELVCGHVISVLSELIVHCDIKIVEAASTALYTALSCKEANKISASKIDFGYGIINQSYLAPFYTNNKKKLATSVIKVNMDRFRCTINDNTLWVPEENTSHEEWITLLVTALLETFEDKSFMAKLKDISKAEHKLCECLLPLILNVLLYVNQEVVDIISSKIDWFLSSLWRLTVQESTTHGSTAVNKKSVKCMLNVVNFVRLQKSFSAHNRCVSDLELNYLKVAQAAEFCALHFTALLYAELWCQNYIDNNDNGSNQLPKGYTMLDVICESESDEVGESLQIILRNAYKAIGDLDALPGCGISFLLKPKFRVEHYKELAQWDRVIHYYDMQAPSTSVSNTDLLSSLKHCSLYQLPLLCNQADPASQYECLWRLGQWNLDEKPLLRDDAMPNYERSKYYALKALHEKDFHCFNRVTREERLCVIDSLRHISLESSKNLYPILGQLQSLNEKEDFAKAIETGDFAMLLTKWTEQDGVFNKNEFEFIEPIVAQRIIMMGDYVNHNDNPVLKSALVDLILNFSDLARLEGQIPVATRSLGVLQSMEGLSEVNKYQIQFREAQLCWDSNDKLAAQHILTKLGKNENVDLGLRAAALKLSGQWLVETYSENRTTIIKYYFLASLECFKSLDNTMENFKNKLDTYDKLAAYADKQYQQIKAHMNSDIFQKKIYNMKKSEETASSILKQSSRTLDERKAAEFHQKQSNIDKTEIENTKKEKDQFLLLALKYYLLNLVTSDENNIRIFRIISLFLENRSNEFITDIIKKLLYKIESYKYINLLPQIMPHLSDNNTDLFSQEINNIVERCAIEHPHHTLPLILALANANQDRCFAGSSTKTSNNDTRVATADKLLKKLEKQPNLRSLIKQLRILSDALIELAYCKVERVTDRQSEFHMPRHLQILKIKDYDDVLMLTYNLPVSKTRNYSNIIGISSFKTSYSTVGGINEPKQITCRGTNGVEYSQLVKGNDDLRQDAVMQQVFTIMNSLLAANKQSKNLLIRTYKIVPLSMRSGILEWVVNSMPIGLYLVGKNGNLGAHSQYRRQDLSPADCRNLFKSVHKKPAAEKLQVFKKLCQKMKPVFHKFFESSFPHPTIWYERRRAYIHSVATTSMCGYILGIGDRHVNNILIDKKTAEVIHIDFGIAFEQGKILQTPETVPFRLTRDIVDGMGVSGVEGIFRRSCEKTLQVLRQNSQTIITILEVLLYDPLYVWTVSPAEANRRQTEDDESEEKNMNYSDEDNTTVNISAERALLRLRGKLQGIEEGSPTSIEHQVGTLIQQAIDPDNLSRLYFGWQPYL